ncbi:hypothetical protein Pmi06nite_39810 [Planotetraspora mira]|uniref:Uncharacterized protein n=1 Tax=Planotetraspora mira TaxID=58121 RepID=A0A8J3TU46_9ACTN|nr:hypothetical protein Pmi06nite_39810 [Planotetraspora mira]
MRTAPFVAAYTLSPGCAAEASVEDVRMIEALFQKRESLLHGEEDAFDVGGERGVVVLLRHGFERMDRATSASGHVDVRALFSQPTGGRESDARRSSGDEGCLAVKLSHPRSPLCVAVVSGVVADGCQAAGKSGQPAMRPPSRVIACPVT